MTDSEIHQALIAAVQRDTDLTDGARAAALDEVNRHNPSARGRAGCRPDPWRACPVIAYYAGVYAVEFGAAGVRSHAKSV